MLIGLSQALSSSVVLPCIQVVPGGAVESFWLQVKRGAEDAGDKHGYSIYFRGAKTSANINDQLRIVGIKEHLGCKALVLAPSTNYNEKTFLFDKDSIPVVFIDRNAGYSGSVSLVATDNYNAGYQAGIYMAKSLGGTGRIAVFRLKKGVSSTDLRESGFIHAAKESGLEIIYDPYIGDNVADGRVAARGILARASGELDGIFTPNETTSSSLLLALEQSPPNKEMVNIGFDINQRLLDGLENNVFTALVVQKPYKIGFIGVENAIDKINGKNTDAFIDTGHMIISRTNLNVQEVKKELLLNYPNLDIKGH